MYKQCQKFTEDNKQPSNQSFDYKIITIYNYSRQTFTHRPLIQSRLFYEDSESIMCDVIKKRLILSIFLGFFFHFSSLPFYTYFYDTFSVFLFFKYQNIVDSIGEKQDIGE